MSKPVELEKLTGLASRFGAFVAERHPFALDDALDGVRARDCAAASRTTRRASRRCAGVSGAS